MTDRMLRFRRLEFMRRRRKGSNHRTWLCLLEMRFEALLLIRGLLHATLIVQLIFLLSCVNSILPSEKTNPDTTKHDFEWQTFVFGEGDPSYFSDVVVIDKNHVWAVGEINSVDSLEKLVDPYNAAFWDGVGWTLILGVHISMAPHG